MRLIKQKHSCSCFPTCLAIVANISYDKACKIVDGRKTKRTWQISPANWQQVYSSYKKAKLHVREYENVDVKSIKELRKLKYNAILMISEPADRTYGHAVLWLAKEKIIYDPSYSPWFKHSYQYVKCIDSIVEVIKCK